MTCPYCAASVRAGGQFCMSCGAFIPAERGHAREAAVVTAAHSTTALAAPDLEPAGLVPRLIANVLDTLLLVAFNLALFAAVLSLQGRGIGAEPVLTVARSFAVPTLAIGALYFAGFESSNWRATPAKRLFGMAVTDEDGDQLGLLHALGRYAAKSLTIALFPIGIWFAPFTARRQTLYDKLVGTVVIER
ncbi:MAG: RDD family protein [Chloroflexi bacterium]|nr:RDD family protein [Chloroflexota bacterium]